MSKFSELDIVARNRVRVDDAADATWVTLVEGRGEFQPAKQSVRTVEIDFCTDGSVEIDMRNGANEWVGALNLPAPFGDQLRTLLFDE